MKLNQIELKDFRNYNELYLEFSQGVHIFIGENAQGKTNLMEAIYCLAMTKSHRSSNDKELIAWDKEAALIKGQIQRRQQHLSLELKFSHKGKTAKVNHLEQRKLSDYLGQLNVILFAPEHLNLVKGAPAIRRRFMDMELGQMNPLYLHHLVTYSRVLKQRNSYLKQLALGKAKDLTYLEVLTQQLIDSAAPILYARLHFVQDLTALALPIHQELSLGKEVFSSHYVSSLDLETGMDQDQLQVLLSQAFDKKRSRELDQASTLVGPHRDDLHYFLNQIPVHTFGSQGQQRSTVLSLKLAEIELMKETTGDYPILLLDDVLSELDDNRQTHLIKAIEDKVQTFITTTSLDGIQQQFINQPMIFPIQGGQVTRP